MQTAGPCYYFGREKCNSLPWKKETDWHLILVTWKKKNLKNMVCLQKKFNCKSQTAWQHWENQIITWLNWKSQTSKHTNKHQEEQQHQQNQTEIKGVVPAVLISMATTRIWQTVIQRLMRRIHPICFSDLQLVRIPHACDTPHMTMSQKNRKAPNSWADLC